MTSTAIYDELYMLVTSRPNYRGRGFVNIDCPACSDDRKRGGFAPTDTGGFRYSCFNGGCQYSDRPTGWEPGNGFGGRVRHLFEMLGGNIKRIPVQDRFPTNRNYVDHNGAVIKRDKTLQTATKFTDVALPKGMDLLDDACTYSPSARAGVEYLNNRTPMLIQSGFPFMWCPAHSRHVIIPYLHYNDQIVGYLGRSIDGNSSGEGRFLQRSAPDYMFNQHLLMTTGSNEHVYVLESPMDAILFNGVAARENRLTEKQINLLKISGRKPILVPNIKDGEYEPFMQVAEENGWAVSIPDWPREWTIKDPGDAVGKIGLLATIHEMNNSITTNYTSARIKLGTKT